MHILQNFRFCCMIIPYFSPIGIVIICILGLQPATAGGIILQDIIKKIIEIDHMAQKMTDEASALKKDAEKSVENDKKTLTDDYLKKARERVEVNKKIEEDYLKQALTDIDARNTGVEESMKKKFADNREKWVDEIYQRVIGG